MKIHNFIFFLELCYRANIYFLKFELKGVRLSFFIAFRRMQGIHFPPWYAGGVGVCHPVGFCFVKYLSPFIHL